MIPRPFSCSARYGIIAATATTETSTPSARELNALREHVGLRDELARRRVAPHGRQQVVGEDVGQRAVAEDVVGRAAGAVDEARRRRGT